jgi:asparagine synthase (glutamine-hydrolysing)
LARQPSAYGHDFASPPNFRHRISEWSTRIRPAWVRQKSYALRRRLGLPEDPDDMLPSAEHMRRVIDLDYPAMRRFFQPENIQDSTVLRRVACLEYLAAQLGSKLAV